MNKSTPQPAAKAPEARPPVSVFLAKDAAGGLVAAGPYAPGKRHDKVPADVADNLVRRFNFKIVPADFAPDAKPAAAAASKEG